MLEEREFDIDLEFLQVLYENAPDAIYLNDLNGTFIHGNKEAERLAGYPREELMGKNYLQLDILSKRDLPRAALALGKNLLGQ